MTCDCSDPIVFGHNCYTYEIPRKTPRTYAAGETFTIHSGGTVMPAREAAHAIRDATMRAGTMQGHPCGSAR